ncbi:MAG TPA: hypothetical protein P5244_07945, partial [Syntrophales bacterium]|nr:hypothetical protein [Syntrophales bacterium]
MKRNAQENDGILYDPDKHLYFVDGRLMPSVTQILSAEGFVDPTWFTVTGAERGTVVHELTRLHDEADLDEASVDPDLDGYLEAWKRFLSDSGILVIRVEQPFASSKYGYCGTPDRIVRFPRDPRLAIIDVKTGHVEPWVG